MAEQRLHKAWVVGSNPTPAILVSIMFLTVHVTVGGVIGTVVGNPLLAFLLGMLSHFALDRIPHWDPPISEYELHKKVSLASPIIRRFAAIAMLDLMGACLVGGLPLGLGYFPHAAASVVGMIGAALPDILFGLFCITGNRWLGKFDTFHQRMHFDPKKIPVNFINGMATQVVTLSLFLGLIFKG